ncbi:SGNH/GDSL hydrolase family protein [Paenibacillus sp. FSL R7-0210]|uniref:SGNH/GDSL hydrolase family protein n=1 Tax=Paenibacillus sp. FSL R7-0210 TaxID=2921676 RepID=UPI0030F504BC
MARGEFRSGGGGAGCGSGAGAVSGAENVKSVKNVESVKSAESVKSVKSVKNLENVKSAERTESVKSGKSLESGKSVGNGKNLKNVRSLPLLEDWFHGAVSLEHRQEGIKPWRIPFRDYDLYPPDGIGGKAEICSGIRLRLTTDSGVLLLWFEPLAEEASLDCVADGRLVQTLRLAAGAGEARFTGLPPGVKELEIYLPQNTGMTISGLAIDDNAVAEPLADRRPRWVTYGSSITQCVAASSPSRTWPVIAAGEIGYHLTNLGFSGNCLMEPMAGRLIRDLPADLITLCVGVNIYGAVSSSPRMFKPLLIGLLETIREKHTETPMVVISPIYGTERETEENPLGFTLPLMRREIADTVTLLQARGDHHLHYLDGLEWFGPSDGELLTDGLHPGPEGYELLGSRFSGRLAAALQGGMLHQ